MVLQVWTGLFTFIYSNYKSVIIDLAIIKDEPKKDVV